MSFSTYAANQILDGNAVDHSAMFVQVHTSSPGASGTAAVSTASPTRASAAFSAVDNVLDNDANHVLPSDGTGSETIRFVTAWDALTGGNLLHQGYISPQISFLAGDTVTFEAGDIILTLDVTVPV